MAIIANMNRGGSKPGERRGGRKKGSLNKATIERALMAEREVANANETRQKTRQGPSRGTGRLLRSDVHVGAG